MIDVAQDAPNTLFLAEDEASLYLQATTSHVWFPTGQTQIVPADAITINVLIAALASAIIWNLPTWFLGISSSSSHVLIGSMIGAVSIGAGVDTIELHGMEKILIALFISPIVGLFCAKF